MERRLISIRLALATVLSARTLACLAATILVLGYARPADAQQGALAYTFESGLQGFHPNGAGTTVSLDPFGATQGSATSMKLSLVAGQTFAAALSEGPQLTPLLADPPGLDFVVFDLTLTEEFPSEGYARIGISLFGASQPDYPGGQQFGLQVNYPTSDEVPVQPLAANVTHQIRINLSKALHPLTFETASFREIFGSGPNDLIPTGFEIYMSKSNNSQWTGYIYNIRLGVNPDANFNHDAQIDGVDLGIWKSSFGLNAGGDADKDGDTDGADFLAWQNQFGPAPGITAAPEPSTIVLAGAMLLGVASQVRRRRISAVGN